LAAISSRWSWLTLPLDAVAALILFALMLMTCIDVLGRYLFNAPLNGATELTELMMAGIIFAALPVVGRREQHINVDLLDSITPRVLVNIRQTLINTIAAVAMAVICWRVWILAARHAEYGDRTEFLQIPVAPVVYFISVMCALAALLLILNVGLYLGGRGPLSPAK
jgi:TRAP-type C4-dicarboxylate transport system permease small subunit